MTHSEQSSLTIELERAALHAIRRTYEDLNGSLFKWSLQTPSFELCDSVAHLGRWISGRRAIELSRTLLVKHGWDVLTEVLKHEMAHQYVSEVLGQPDEHMHGQAFRRVCEERGIDARASGIPEARGQSDQDAQILERIAKLLALAESANEHEAQAAMSAAQRLMLKYNIDMTVRGARGDYAFRHVGTPTGRLDESRRILARILSDFFFVEVIWVPVWRALEGKRGTVLEVCGSSHNVELADYVHAFLTHTAEQLWKEHKHKHALKKDTARKNFLAGVMSGFRERLERERKKSKAEGLVWVGDAELGRYFRRRHPHIRRTRYAIERGSEAYAHGHAAGQQIVLHRGVSAGPTAESPRLLPAKS